MNKLTDGMKTEGKSCRNTMIMIYICTALIPVLKTFGVFSSFSDKDILLITIYCFLLGTVALYGWLYALKYRLVVTQDKVEVKTLFRKYEVNLGDIKYYTCQRYKKSAFYQFRLFIDGTGILVTTRYKDDFIKILTENSITEKQIKNK